MLSACVNVSGAARSLSVIFGADLEPVQRLLSVLLHVCASFLPLITVALIKS